MVMPFRDAWRPSPVCRARSFPWSLPQSAVAGGLRAAWTESSLYEPAVVLPGFSQRRCVRSTVVEELSQKDDS